MTQLTVSCPHCRTLLQSRNPIPAGAPLRCPGCKGAFVAPPPLPPVTSRPAGSGLALLIAVSAAALLGGSLLGAAVILSLTRPAAAPARQETDLRVDAGRKQLDDERKKLDDERQKFAAERKKADLTRLLARGDEALRAERYTEAEKAFEEALRVAPGDAAAVRGLVAARAALATDAKTRAEEKKKQADVDRLLADGKKALAEKRTADAVRLLKSAQLLAPARPAVLSTLQEAEAAVEAERVAADFRRLMDAGRAALKEERFADAVREFVAAERLRPEDLDARQARRQAEGRLEGLADARKRDAAFGDFLERGRAALDRKRYTEAVDALDRAARIRPDDREAKRELDKARRAQKAAKSENSKLLARANEAVRLDRVEEARQLAQDAADVLPEDPHAERLLRSLTRRIEDGRTGLAAYQRFVEQGDLAVLAVRNADAIRAYTEALRLMPGDLEVARRLRLAQRALLGDARAALEYERHLRAGDDFLRRRAFPDSIKAFEAALRLLPDDLRASAGLSKARYAQAMLDGQRALGQRRRTDAVKAFEAALTEAPGDVQAHNGLRMARALR